MSNKRTVAASLVGIVIGGLLALGAGYLTTHMTINAERDARREQQMLKDYDELVSHRFEAYRRLNMVATTAYRTLLRYENDGPIIAANTTNPFDVTKTVRAIEDQYLSDLGEVSAIGSDEVVAAAQESYNCYVQVVNSITVTLHVDYKTQAPQASGQRAGAKEKTCSVDQFLDAQIKVQREIRHELSETFPDIRASSQQSTNAANILTPTGTAVVTTTTLP